MTDTDTVTPDRPVIVRTYSSGVHFGYLASRNGKEVRLERSQRIWKLAGIWTLSDIAVNGIDNLGLCVACPVSIDLTEVLEIIDASPDCVKSIEAASWAK